MIKTIIMNYIKSFEQYINEKFDYTKQTKPNVQDEYNPKVRLKEVSSSSKAEEWILNDILVDVYSYSSRHVNFYKVVGFSGKSTIILHSLEEKIVSGSYNIGGEVVPDLNKESNVDVKVRINKYGNCKTDKYRDYLHLWDGKPESIYTD